MSEMIIEDVMGVLPCAIYTATQFVWGSRPRLFSL